MWQSFRRNYAVLVYNYPLADLDNELAQSQYSLQPHTIHHESSTPQVKLKGKVVKKDYTEEEV